MRGHGFDKRVLCLMAACLAACADATGADQHQDEVTPEEHFDYPTTIAVARVTQIPIVDGDAGDAAWTDAVAATAGTTRWKAVYTADELALLVTWPDRNLIIDTVGSWHWDPEGLSWSTTRQKLGPGKKYAQKSFHMAFDITNTTIKDVGCQAFCHVDGDVQHHNTTGPGAYADVWLLLGKHGFGAASGGPSFGTGKEDVGWLLGVDGATQSGNIVFDPEDTANPRSILVGEFTFQGYGEDKSVSAIGDDTFASPTKPALQYCARCHDNKPGVSATIANYKMEQARTFGDDGEISYFRNGDLLDLVPLYMETAPLNFVDALVLTQAEIDAAEAVEVAGLTPEQIRGYWANYAAVNAVVPELVLKTPTGGSADVRVAATWKSGAWTLEVKRKLLTGNPDDVQFSDLGKPYYFAATLTGGPPPLLKSGGTSLQFVQ